MSEEIKFDVVGSIYGREYSEFGQFVSAENYDTAQSELAALREELASVSSMACMLEDREWAEHAGKGPIAEKMESAITELHNELSESRQRLADAERRNMFCESMLRQIMPCLAMSTNTTAPTYMRQIDAALTKPEEAKS